MPASTLDPVNAAIRNSLSKTASETNIDLQLAGATKKALLADIEFEAAGSYQTSVLDKLKTKYIVLKSSSESQQTSNTEKMGADETLVLVKHELYPLDAVQLGWSNTEWVVGAGMVNMGNTCYLNSTLQALFHVPALVNWLISDKQHMSQCEDSGGLCIICAMRKTLQDSQQRNTNSIRPFLIYNKLRVVCRNLIPGRQEDAHEFLRYLVEAMEKAYLRRFKNHSEFDSRTKETTPLNQILGGYLRSAVRCLECGHVSTTFQHFQDLLLDIRKAQTLDEALGGYFSREKLDDESYHCESCQKKVPATKQFSLERAPMVLCIQLKRFSVSNNKITKHVQFRPRLELTKYARHRPPVPLLYRFVALVTHMGPTVGCGHYTAVAQAPCGNYYQFDDSMVRPISHQAVFSTNAYIMLYELECPPFAQKTQNPSGGASSSVSCSTGKTKANASANSNTCVVRGSPCNSSASASGYYDDSNRGGGVVLNIHNAKNSQPEGGGSATAEKSMTNIADKIQLNGSARTLSEPALPSNVDMIMTITMTTATVTTTSIATTTTPFDQNGVALSSDSHAKKANGSTIAQQHATLLLLSSSSTDNSQHSRQHAKRQQQEKGITPTAVNRSPVLRQNGEVTTTSSLTTAATAPCEPTQKCKSPKASSYRSSTMQFPFNDVANSPGRSCSSSSVSSLSSNVDRGGSSSPKTIESPKTTTTPSTSTVASMPTLHSLTKLVPYDVDDDDEDDDNNDEEEDDDREYDIEEDNEIDAECSSSSGSCTFVEMEATVANRNEKGVPRPDTTTTITAAATATTTVRSLTAATISEATRVPTKATTADWQVTSSVDRSSQTPSSEGRSWNKKHKAIHKESGVLSCASTVSELLKMSHAGYSAPVSSWNGSRAVLDKEINEERREERKRAMCDISDRGRVKHLKSNSSSSNSYNSNPGYNRLQEFHNAKNSWNQYDNPGGGGGSAPPSSSSYGSRQFYNTSEKHRKRRNNFHNKNNNYHKNNYAFRQ